MSRLRIAKVRITNHRPPTAGSRSPLEAARLTSGGNLTGLDYLTAVQEREKREHDRAVRDYDEETLLAAAQDLGKRMAWDRKDPEARWVMARKAALMRALDRKGAFK